MKQPDSFFRRVGQSLGLFAAEPQEAVEHPDKRNLSPFMGRRDAAIDRLSLPEDLFTRSAAERQAEYRRLIQLLDCARHDTAAVLRMLSSPDTRRREDRLGTVLALYQELAAALFYTADAQILLVERRPDGCSRETDGTISRCESMLLNEYRETVSATRPSIDRYREYTAKSFSPENLERYRKAYAENSTLFDAPGFLQEGL